MFVITDTKAGDYHDDMNHTNFMLWTKTKLLPNLPPKSVLIVDNALYHNVAINKDPQVPQKKSDMLTWLVHMPHDPK
jgi:hypothetical protein